MRTRLILASTALLCVLVASIAVLVGLRVASVKGPTNPAVSNSSTPSPPQVVTPAPSTSGNKAVVYLYYYLWWTPQHWAAKLGPNYPIKKYPPPRPGATNAVGCNPRTSYSGSTIVDVPQQGLYDQNEASTYEVQIEEAAKAGVTGFLVSWQGTGLPGQTPRSSGYDQRLALMVGAVDAYNQSNPANQFHLSLAFSAFGDYTRSANAIVADLKYFATAYGNNLAFRNPFSSHPVVMLMDSRKYSVATVRAVWSAQNGNTYLVGDETPQSWIRDAPYLDGSSYYWSSENPATNPRAGSDLESLAAQVHGDGKAWFAPFIPGYNTQLLGGSCVPRDGVNTLETIWQTNALSQPNGWFGISWNEFVENTYFQPSVAYGSDYLTELRRLIEGSA